MALRLSEFTPENTSVLKKWSQSIEDRLKWLEKYGRFTPTGNYIVTNSHINPTAGQWWMTPTHMSYRPLTNPLTGTVVGVLIPHPVINIAAFTMRVGHQDIAVNGGSIASGLAFDTLYFVYYDDIYLAGGAVTYYCDQFKEVAINGDGRLFVGSIRTPVSATGVDTIGNNDGGVGAQMGGHVARYATASNITSTGGTLTGAAYALDKDWATCAQVAITMSNLDGITFVITLAGFGSPEDVDRWFTHARLRVKAGGSYTTESGSGGATNSASVKIEYTENNGASWSTIRSASSYGNSVSGSLVDQIDTVTLTDGVNPNKVQVRITAQGNGDPSILGDDGSLLIKMYEAIVEGDY